MSAVLTRQESPVKVCRKVLCHRNTLYLFDIEVVFMILGLVSRLYCQQFTYFDANGCILDTRDWSNLRIKKGAIDGRGNPTVGCYAMGRTQCGLIGLLLRINY